MKIDRRKGIKPTQQHAKMATKLLGLHATRDLTRMVNIDYLTLKKIEKRISVMPQTLTQLENVVNSLKPVK